MWCFIWALAENSVQYIVSQGRQCIAACLQIRAMVSVKDLTSLNHEALRFGKCHSDWTNVIQNTAAEFSMDSYFGQWVLRA